MRIVDHKLQHKQNLKTRHGKARQSKTSHPENRDIYDIYGNPFYFFVQTVNPQKRLRAIVEVNQDYWLFSWLAGWLDGWREAMDGWRDAMEGQDIIELNRKRNVDGYKCCCC